MRMGIRKVDTYPRSFTRLSHSGVIDHGVGMETSEDKGKK
jgi:hypothetical protein